MPLMTIHQCKSLTELPGAVARFERDVDAYEQRTQRPFPPEFRVPAFLRMAPKSHASDMRWRFSHGATDYGTLKSTSLSYTQHVRFEGSYGKGDTDMQVDVFGYAKCDVWSDWIAVAEPCEVTAFYEGVAAGLSSEVLDRCLRTLPSSLSTRSTARAKAKAKARTPVRARARAMASKLEGRASKVEARATGSSRATSAASRVEAKVTGSSSSSQPCQQPTVI